MVASVRFVGYQEALLGAVVVFLVMGIVLGCFTHKLAKKKGYKGYFWTGFFFNSLGFLYVLGLPVAEEEHVRILARAINQAGAARREDAPPQTSGGTGAWKGFVTCPSCGKEQPESNDRCWKCNAVLKPER